MVRNDVRITWEMTWQCCEKCIENVVLCYLLLCISGCWSSRFQGFCVSLGFWDNEYLEIFGSHFTSPPSILKKNGIQHVYNYVVNVVCVLLDRFPSLIPLMASEDPPQLTFCLLQNLQQLMDRSSTDIQRDHILPMLSRF